MLDRSAASPGFSVRLEGASLFDLVQFECLDRERKLLRVTAAGRTGFLFFRDGNLVHATTSDLVGEAAVRAMLGWENGQVTHSEGVWPTNESITSSWQSVLLRIAHADDEEGRNDNVVSFPIRDGSGGSSEAGMRDQPSGDVDAVHVVHISSSGDVRAAAADREVADTLAYAIELADLLGDALAIDRASSIEAWTSESQVLLVREAKTDELHAAWASKDVDASELRARLSREHGR